MKISKSFKITTYIFIGFLFVNNLFADSGLLNNLVIHDQPKKITNVTFKDSNLQDVDLSKNKGKIMVLNFLGNMVCPMQKRNAITRKVSSRFTANRCLSYKYGTSK